MDQMWAYVPILMLLDVWVEQGQDVWGSKVQHSFTQGARDILKTNRALKD